MEEEGEAWCKVVRTNSGEESVDTCDKKSRFQGAGAAERRWVVVDIARRNVVGRSRWDSGAIFDEVEEAFVR